MSAADSETNEVAMEVTEIDSEASEKLRMNDVETAELKVGEIITELDETMDKTSEELYEVELSSVEGEFVTRLFVADNEAELVEIEVSDNNNLSEKDEIGKLLATKILVESEDSDSVEEGWTDEAVSKAGCVEAIELVLVK